MPKTYTFQAKTCSQNENLRNNITGCRYVAKVPEFKPHRNGHKPDHAKNLPKLEVPKPPSFAKPTAPTATETLAAPTANPTIVDQVKNTVSTAVNDQLTQTLNQYGLGHLAPSTRESLDFSPNDDDDDDSNDGIFMKVVKNHIKASKHKKLDDFVEYHNLTPEEIQAARMTKASYINLTEGSHASNAYANSLIDGWKIDHELSNEHATTFVDEKGNVRIAYRGTQHGLFKGQDWVTNRKMAFGREGTAKQIQEIEQHYDNVIEKYATKANPKPVELFTGHSKGGGQAIIMGERKGVTTITQDPALTPKMIATATNSKHIINRTPTDYVSALTPIAELTKSNNFVHRKIRSQTGTGVLGAHDVTNMTDYDYKPVKGMGNTEYNPEAKNRAFIAKHIQDGKTIDEIQSMTGHEEGSQEHDRLREHYDAVKDLDHNQVMEEAGYSTRPQSIPQKIMSKISDKVVSAVEGKTSAAAHAANTVINKSSAAGLGAALATTYGLDQLNVDPNEAAMIGGGVGNVAGDLVQNLNRTTARNVVARTAAQNVSKAAVTGLKSFAKGGASAGVGIVVEEGSHQVLDAVGVHGTANEYASAAAGGAAAGAIFGPEGAIIGAGVSVAVTAVGRLFDWWMGYDKEPPHPSWDEREAAYVNSLTAEEREEYERQKRENRDHRMMRYAKENKEAYTDSNGIYHDYGDTVVDLIEADSQFQELMNAQPQDTFKINERIREVVHHHWNWRTSTANLIYGNAKGLPQITPDGQWRMTRYTEPNPMQPGAMDYYNGNLIPHDDPRLHMVNPNYYNSAAWHNQPHPITAHEYTPPPKYQEDGVHEYTTANEYTLPLPPSTPITLDSINANLGSDLTFSPVLAGTYQNSGIQT